MGSRKYLFPRTWSNRPQKNSTALEFSIELKECRDFLAKVNIQLLGVLLGVTRAARS